MTPADTLDLVVAGATAVIAVSLTAPFATALARLQFPGRALALAILVFASATPPAVLDTTAPSLGARFAAHLALALPLAAWVFYLAARTWPRHLEDASRLDDAPPFTHWPALARPAAVTAGALVFLYCMRDLTVR